MSKFTGPVTVRVNGTEYPSDGKGTVSPGGMKREPATDGLKVLGFTEEYEAPKFKFKLRHGKDTSMKEVQEWTDATVLVETDTGRKFIGRGGFTTNVLELSEGTFDVEMSALSCDEE